MSERRHESIFDRAPLSIPFTLTCSLPFAHVTGDFKDREGRSHRRVPRRTNRFRLHHSGSGLPLVSGANQITIIPTT